MKTLKFYKVLAAVWFVGLLLVSQGLFAQSNTPNNNNSNTTEDKVNAVIQVLGAISNAMQQVNNNNATAPQNSNNGNYNNGGYNSNYNNTNTPAPQQTHKKTPCAHCKATGKCPYCDGQGYRWNQVSRQKTQCIWCNGNGRCHWCNGKCEL